MLHIFSFCSRTPLMRISVSVPSSKYLVNICLNSKLNSKAINSIMWLLHILSICKRQRFKVPSSVSDQMWNMVTISASVPQKSSCRTLWLTEGKLDFTIQNSKYHLKIHNRCILLILLLAVQQLRDVVSFGLKKKRTIQKFKPQQLWCYNFQTRQSKYAFHQKDLHIPLTNRIWEEDKPI